MMKEQGIVLVTPNVRCDVVDRISSFDEARCWRGSARVNRE